jgi:hypothetical protein
MSYLINQSAAGHVALLDRIKEFATSNSVTAVSSVAAGGTGYTVGDVLTASGGTSTIAAQFVVTTVGGGGAVTAVRISQSGAYTSNPGNPVSTTGGTGTGCTLNLTFASNGWTLKRRTKKAASATVGAGGTGYTVGDDLTVALSPAGEAAAVFNVDTVSGGVVTAVSLVTAGRQHETVANPAATTGGTGTGCTLNVTYVDNTDDFNELILQGVGSGADQLFIGIRSYATGTPRNFELAGFTGYTATAPWANQPGVSPGRWDLNEQGAYVPLNTTTINYWLFINGRRIIGIFKNSGAYPNMYLGWTNPFGTAAEFPYPMYVGGCSSEMARAIGSTVIGYSGAVDPVGADGHTSGPHFIRSPEGVWKTVQNSRQSGSALAASDDLVVWPAGTPGKLNLPAVDQAGNGILVTTDFIPNTGNPGTQADRLLQTPGSPNLAVLIPTMIIEEGNQSNIARMVHGELDNLYWCSSNMDLDAAFAASEDLIIVGTDRYWFFQNCGRTDTWKFFTIKEE